MAWLFWQKRMTLSVAMASPIRNMPRRLLRSGRPVPESTSPVRDPANDEPRIEAVDHEGLQWINIERPGASEEAWLRENFEFHNLDYEDVRSHNQRPKIDEYDDYLFIVLHLPVFDKKVGRLNAAELDFFVGEDFVVTLPNEPLKPVEYLFERCRSNDETRAARMSRGPGYLLYTIVDDAFSYCFPMLRKIGIKLDRIESDIFVEGRSREVVRDISNVKQEIINFRKIIRPQRVVLRDLERTKARFISSPEPDTDLEIYFDDIFDASERMWDMLENFKEVIEALEATNETVLTHAVNDILRVLTAMSVVFLPLTLIASIWGMNVHVPGQGDMAPFFVIAGVMVAMLISMLLYFKHRDWL